MSHYRSNLRDIEFNLFEVLGRDAVLGQGPFADVDVDTARSILAEVERLATHELADSFTDVRPQPAGVRPGDAQRPVPESFARSYRAWMDAEWWRLQVPAELGGHAGARVAAVGGGRAGARRQPGGVDVRLRSRRSPRVIHRNGTERDQRIAQHIVDRRWGATMVLTEPDAGSDVGAGRTRALLQDDGSWHLEGVKRFITSGEHDLSENIVHLVLARPVGRRGRRRPGHQGTEPVPRAQAPLRPRRPAS